MLEKVIDKKDYRAFVKDYIIDYFKKQYNVQVEIDYISDSFVITYDDNYFIISLLEQYIYKYGSEDSFVNNSVDSITRRLSKECNDIVVLNDYEKVKKMIGGINYD